MLPKEPGKIILSGIKHNYWYIYHNYHLTNLQEKIKNPILTYNNKGGLVIKSLLL